MLEIKFNNKTLKTERAAFVMGIVNVTSDSFFEPSRGGLERALKLIDEGADILDIGAESTRPGFVEVSAEKQIALLVPIIKEIRKKSDVVISIDTRSSEVFKACYEAGADILNDVSSLESDSKMLDVLVRTNASVILMHGFGINENHPVDLHITTSVYDFLESRAKKLLSNGLTADKIILDPGIGFGKTYEENILLIKNTSELCKNYTVLMALSRKRCIGSMLARENSADERLVGTLTADLFSVISGAKIIRVHDVQAAIDSLNVMKYLR